MSDQDTDLPVVGDQQILRMSVTGTTGAPTDPATLVARVQSPSGVETSQAYGDGVLTKAATGDYRLPITFSEDGDWWVRVKSTFADGTVRVREMQVEVLPSRLRDGA